MHEQMFLDMTCIIDQVESLANMPSETEVTLERIFAASEKKGFFADVEKKAVKAATKIALRFSKADEFAAWRGSAPLDRAGEAMASFAKLSRRAQGTLYRVLIPRLATVRSNREKQKLLDEINLFCKKSLEVVRLLDGEIADTLAGALHTVCYRDIFSFVSCNYGGHNLGDLERGVTGKALLQQLLKLTRKSNSAMSVLKCSVPSQVGLTFQDVYGAGEVNIINLQDFIVVAGIDAVKVCFESETLFTNVNPDDREEEKAKLQKIFDSATEHYLIVTQKKQEVAVEACAAAEKPEEKSSEIIIDEAGKRSAKALAALFLAANEYYEKRAIDKDEYKHSFFCIPFGKSRTQKLAAIEKLVVLLNGKIRRDTISDASDLPEPIDAQQKDQLSLTREDITVLQNGRLWSEVIKPYREILVAWGFA